MISVNNDSSRYRRDTVFVKQPVRTLYRKFAFIQSVVFTTVGIPLIQNRMITVITDSSRYRRMKCPIFFVKHPARTLYRKLICKQSAVFTTVGIPLLQKPYDNGKYRFLDLSSNKMYLSSSLSNLLEHYTGSLYVNSQRY